MTLPILLFLSWNKGGVSAACCALALLHCIHTHAHTGDNHPFPLPQHDNVCAVCALVSVCKWRSRFMWQMGSHSCGSHGGGTKSFLDAITFTPPKNYLDGIDSCWTGQIQDLCKCIGRMCMGDTTTKLSQIRPTRAKSNQGSDQKPLLRICF